jgi:hypothetical protein
MSARRSWHTRCFNPFESELHRSPHRDDIALELTAKAGHFLKEIVMRNFIYSFTLVAVAFLQIAVVIVELTRA